MKKNNKEGFPPVIKMRCGGRKDGCKIIYITPHAGTQQDLERHNREDMKEYQSKQAA